MLYKKADPPLFGQEWLRNMKLNWAEIKAIETLKKGFVGCWTHRRIFSDEFDTLERINARIKVRESATPKFRKACAVLLALRHKVDKKLDRLVEAGILSKVEQSEWATPIATIPKKDGSVRICGDFKVTLNPVLYVYQYPLQKIENIFASLAGR